MRIFTDRKAFTLIELLIVVAIIAILAAIAVPNFLEAQTRAKVSRAKADMRSIETAMQSYRVDNNTYPHPQLPIAGDDLLPTGPNPDCFRSLWGFVPYLLTTPVSYMTSLPDDPFAKYYTPSTGSGSVYLADPGTLYVRYRLTNRYPWVGVSYADASGNPPLAVEYDPGWETFFWYHQAYEEVARTADPNVADPFHSGSHLMLSVGPDRTETNLPRRVGFPAVYDPTNGTTSDGDITYIGGGGFQDDK